VGRNLCRGFIPFLWYEPDLDLACECSAQPRIKMVTRLPTKGFSSKRAERLGSLIYVCCKEVNEICGSIYELGVV